MTTIFNRDILTMVIKMNEKMLKTISEPIKNFRLPKFEEIPDVGLYLEQTTKYISQIYAPVQEITLTSSMISNYVKKGLIPNPVKKQYNREQIAYLIFIASAKLVLSMDFINTLLNIQKKTYSAKSAYNYFCDELENMLKITFGLEAEMYEIDDNKTKYPEIKGLLRTAIANIANKIYLEKCFLYYNNNEIIE